MLDEETLHDNNSLPQEFLKHAKETLADYYDFSNVSAGGMGQIFFCQDKRSKEFCVLKTFKEEYTKNKNFKTIFEKEAKFALNLGKHPNIVYTKTVVIENGRHYMVMELIGKQPKSLQDEVEGHTLVNELNNNFSIPKKKVILWSLEFCEGMQYLVKKGMKAHKDIKPSNLFITEEGHLKIGDFGLADLEGKGGTRGYRAPEYYDKNKDLDIRSDIFSFGSVLYQMINHYSLENETKLITHNPTVLNGTAEPEFIDPKKIKSKYFTYIIRKCRQKDRNKRYQSIKELKADLEKEAKKINLKFDKPRIIKMYPEEYSLKGEGFYNLGKYEEAIKYLNIAIKLNPQLARVYYYRFYSHYKLKHSTLASKDIIKYINLVKNKEDIDILFERAVAERTVDAELALDMLNEIRKYYSKNAKFYYERGLTNMYLLRFKRALKDMQKVISLTTNAHLVEEAKKIIEQLRNK